MYGTDIADNPPEPGKPVENPPLDPGHVATDADHAWRSDWRYLATPQTQRIDDLNTEVKGLGLPRSVIDKIYYTNAQRIYLHEK